MYGGPKTNHIRRTVGRILVRTSEGRGPLGAEVQRDTFASDPGRAPRGGGPLGAVLSLLPKLGPENRDQPGQGAAQAVGAVGEAIEGEGQGEN